MSERHIADAEPAFKVVNITPDFCKVNGQVVPFDIFQILPPERSNYAKKVRARKEKVLHVASIVSGVVGNAGSGVISGVSQGSGDVVVLEGATKVRVEGQLCARHRDLCLMNVKSG
ncbi:PAAR-like domain-containing protein [Chondromyces apiculatus]|uniref:Uncharacterized protein n=1 Tax=Chondromyces apiculatus DSM 436 TaxID=1192034 RepID=A0A017T7Z1_9BACT|nr:PAAR-like domain-containing protein [Chondromyces apiculatus]EYF05388.1 Hypothetical protein CAP_3305 [Chondromyces apiculatus DSM 436]